MSSLINQRSRVNDWLSKNKAAFVSSYGGVVEIQENPYDPIPRVLSADEFTYIEQGLIQRTYALNLFLNDIYGDRMILRDRVIPEEFIFSSPDFNTACMGISPVKGIYNHMSAADLVQSAEGKWYVMEDNLSNPSGSTYALLARQLNPTRPEGFDASKLCDNAGLPILLNQLYHDLKQGLGSREGISIVLAQNRSSLANFELAYLAESTEAVLVRPDELSIMDDCIYYRPASGGGFQRVSVILRQTPDIKIDPLAFDLRSTIGVPHLMEACGKGKVAVINAPGAAIADDRGLYYFVPKIIKYYLDEEPLIPNIPSYLPSNSADMKFILDNMDKLVIKNVISGSRRGTFFPHYSGKEDIRRMKNKLVQNPRRYVAQEFIDIMPLDTLSPEGDKIVKCKGDFRSYIIHSDSIRVWMGGLSRFNRGYAAGDSARQGGFKDTWVLSD